MVTVHRGRDFPECYVAAHVKYKNTTRRKARVHVYTLEEREEKGVQQSLEKSISKHEPSLLEMNPSPPPSLIPPSLLPSFSSFLIGRWANASPTNFSPSFTHEKKREKEKETER